MITAVEHICRWPTFSLRSAFHCSPEEYISDANASYLRNRKLKYSIDKMPSEFMSNKSLISIGIASAGSSLMDILNQESCEMADQLNMLTAVQFLNSPIVSVEPMMDTENNKLSTLFSTTGRERNSTGPLKQWLYEHQDHPCKCFFSVVSHSYGCFQIRQRVRNKC